MRFVKIAKIIALDNKQLIVAICVPQFDTLLHNKTMGGSLAR